MSLRISEDPTQRGSRAAVGPGPERATFQAAAQRMVLVSSCWRHSVYSSDVYILNLSVIDSHSTPERTTAMRAYGAFIALFLFKMTQGPPPVSFWLLLVWLEGPHAMISVPERIVQHLDPKAYKELAPWYKFKHTDNFPTVAQASHPLRVSWIQHFESAPVIFAVGRSEQEHEYAPWTKKDWADAKSSFLLEWDDFDFGQTIRALGALPFLVSVYNRRIRHPDDLSPHLRFVTSDDNRDDARTTALFTKLGELRIKCYLRGCGHPAGAVPQLVTQAQFDDARGDPLLRSYRLLSGSSDNDMLPISPGWAIEFTFNHRRPRSNHEEKLQRSSIPTALDMHTCADQCGVDLNKGMEELLLGPAVSDPNVATPLDLWFHEQIGNRKYNRI
ncbi:hypothetical protein FB45DRAFT_951582 [Roridomyces roridus]|uniref:Uncharacterized protein n=1 Tax=Roridomyces roridus TaxID=1738132 RepID=A0AAD7B013_9AGAR|nr:hypothetical protein FB45DRAFT_951582 [Roridomyces roridus]